MPLVVAKTYYNKVVKENQVLRDLLIETRGYLEDYDCAPYTRQLVKAIDEAITALLKPK